MMICDRCRKETRAYTMSMFSTDEICLDCKKAEKEHPDYERARLAEAEAVRAGNFNFPGIGVPADLR